MTDTVPTEVPATESRGRGLVGVHEDMNAVQAKQMALIDALIAWLIGNPGKPWTIAAQQLGYTPQWIRRVVSTDAFRARYKEVSGDVHGLGLSTLRDKLNVATEIVLERIAEKAALAESLSDLNDSAEVLLKANGYGIPGGGNPLQSQQPAVSVNVILEQRDLLMHRPQPATIEVIPQPPTENA